MALSDNETKARNQIASRVKNLSWREARELGINMQQVVKMKKGEPVRFHDRNFKRLKKHFGLGTK